MAYADWRLTWFELGEGTIEVVLVSRGQGCRLLGANVLIHTADDEYESGKGETPWPVSVSRAKTPTGNPDRVYDVSTFAWWNRMASSSEYSPFIDAQMDAAAESPLEIARWTPYFNVRRRTSECVSGLTELRYGSMKAGTEDVTTSFRNRAGLGLTSCIPDNAVVRPSV